MDRRQSIALTALLVVGCGARDEAAPVASVPPPPLETAARVPPPPPPPPPAPFDDVILALAVEFPDGRKVDTIVGQDDCPTEKLCGDYYGIAGFMEAGFHKLSLPTREACTGPKHYRECTITAIGDTTNSAQGRWVMFRNGHRNPYPYNHIVRDVGGRTERVTYRFLPSKN